jgi:hypothetical protein
MGDFDLGEYFEEHPERWMSALAAAGIAALIFARKAAKAKGFFRKAWNLSLLLVQIGAVAGLIKAKQQGSPS